MSTIYKEGNYPAKVVDYGVGTSQAGNPQVAILFQFKDETGAQKKLTYFGGFSTKQSPYTLKNLVTLGLKGGLETLAEGPKSGALDMETEFEIVIGHNTWEGKTTARVNFINLPGMGGGKPLAEKDGTLGKMEAKSLFEKMGLNAELLTIKREMGVPATGGRKAKPEPEDMPDPDFSFEPDFNHQSGPA